MEVLRPEGHGHRSLRGVFGDDAGGETSTSKFAKQEKHATFFGPIYIRGGEAKNMGGRLALHDDSEKPTQQMQMCEATNDLIMSTRGGWGKSSLVGVSRPFLSLWAPQIVQGRLKR